MKHIKTLNTQTLNNTMKKADVENARHLVSQHVRHLAQLEIKLANKRNKLTSHRLRSGSGFGRCFVFALRRKEQNTSDSSVCK